MTEGFLLSVALEDPMYCNGCPSIRENGRYYFCFTAVQDREFRGSARLGNALPIPRPSWCPLLIEKKLNPDEVIPLRKIKIEKAERNGKTALWIKIPSPYNNEHATYNIWDLPSEFANNSQIMDAIAHSFELGMLARENLVKRGLSQTYSVEVSDE